MTTSYIDTSGIVKKYIDEKGSEEVHSHIAEVNFLFTSFLTELETWATLEQSKRLRRLNTPAYRESVHSFERDLQGGCFTVIPMSHEIHTLAKRLIRQRGLKTPDAIQLASALRAEKTLSDQLLFVCADHALLEAARLEGLKCVDVSA